MSSPVANIQLTEHFSLREMTKSQTAMRRGIDNTPTDEHMEALTSLCTNILEPIRKHFGVAVLVSSGYRSPELCREIGSKSTSQHAKGQAADFELGGGVSNYDVAWWCRENLDFDQLILEYYTPDDPKSGWVHISYRDDGKNRDQVLTYDGANYTIGLSK